ncbi:MAG: tetratricopeptide repeat protein, partial [Candidatus Sabulitectum sp.]|nr:tetratricopeptide repeat protein [Candidatus Sabulitectum sp.]
MLRDILAKLEGIPLLIILSYRPERPNGTPVEMPMLEHIATKKEIVLEPLRTKESIELLTRLIDTDSFDEDSVSAMAETTGGYPLHLELIANARNNQRISYSENELSDLQLLIQKNYARLPEGRRLIIQALSVLGGEAPVQLVLDTVSTKPALGKSVLLQDDDFAVRKQTSFADTLVFRHDLFKEAVYDTMGADSRKNFHLRAAVLLEGIHQSDSRFSSVISKHWKKAGNNQSALDHAAAYLNHVDTIFHSTAVLEWADEVESIVTEMGLTEENADTLARALTAAEETLGRTGQTPMREEALNRLEKLATRYNLIDHLTSAYCSRGLIRKDQGRYDEAVKLVQKSADMAESHHNSYKAACALGTLASIISDLRDRLEEAEILYLRAHEMLENLDAPKDLGKSCMHLGILYTEMGKNQKAIEYLNRASELFKSIEFHYGEAVVLTNQANIYVKMDRSEEALTAMDRSVVLLRKAGDSRSLAITLGNRANLFSSRGDLDYATNEYKKAIELHMQADNSRSEKKSRCNLADCLMKRGLFDSALEELEKADLLNEHSGDSYWKARILNGRGRALLENGQYKQASKTLQSSLAISHKEKYEALKRSTLIGLAMTAFLSSNHTAAEEYCSLVLATVDEDRRDTQLLEASIILADVMLAAGSHGRAVEYAAQANEVAKIMKKNLLDIAAASAEGRVLLAMEDTVQGNLLLKNAASIADECGYGNLFWFR